MTRISSGASPYMLSDFYRRLWYDEQRRNTMSDMPTFHRGDRNFGTGYDMMDHIEALEAELAEARRRRDAWKEKAEGYDTIRVALREKVGAPWPPHLSRAIWAALAADEKKRADDAEAERGKLREALIHLRGAYDCGDVVDAALRKPRPRSPHGRRARPTAG